MNDYKPDQFPNARPSAQNLVLCFLQPRFWPTSGLPTIREFFEGLVWLDVLVVRDKLAGNRG